MSDTKKSTKSETKAAPKPAETKSTETKSTESKTEATATPASSDSGDGGKSARDSIGGAAVGHYGYFSNIKTPEYKSGWDDIWGKKESGGKKKNAAEKPEAAAKPKAPRVVSFDFEDLPADLQAALAKEARAQFKKARVNYDNRDKSGAVTWRIDCTVER
ncbi:MAG: hypothetical protein ACI9JL_003662 [Paracoccaceae bacterium]|jgi:hypothetical protein